MGDENHVTCLIASGSEILNDGISGEIQNAFRTIETLKAKTFNEAGDILLEKDVDILIIGKITLGFEIEEQAKKLFMLKPNLRILCFCEHNCQKFFGLRLYRAGIKGVIIDRGEEMKLIESLKRTIEGKLSFTDEITAAIENNEHVLNAELNGKFTNREMEVLEQMIAGKPLKVVSDELHLAIGTLSAMRTRIQKKLGASNCIEAIIIALEYGIGHAYLMGGKKFSDYS